MGSAVTRRDDRWYRAAAELGQLLARAGYLVASGGGPANMGAFLAPHQDPDVLDDALAELAQASAYGPDQDHDAYTEAASAVRARWLAGSGPSLAIPTRVDGLVSIAISGIAFAPGRSGTVQELFQDAAQSAYGIRGRSPMVLLGREAYGGDPSVYAVLRDQARRFGGYERLVTLCDDPADALSFIQANEPIEAADALTGSPEEVLDFMRNDRVRAR